MKLFIIGRQDGKLIIHRRECAYGECKDCGVAKNFTNIKCDLEWDSSCNVKYKEYQNLTRNNSDVKQKELVLVTSTAEELMKKISNSAAEVIKHTWEAYWNSHQRKYLTQNFTYGMVLYKADFSATMDLNSQDRMNCAIPAHAL